MAKYLSKRMTSVLRIGVSETGITLVRTSGWLRLRSEVVADCLFWEDELVSPTLMVQKLRELLEQEHCLGLPARFVFADSMVRSWVVTPPPNAVRLFDCQAAAAARFQALYGETIADWEMQAAWDVKHAFLACAMPRSLLAQLMQVAADCKLVVLEMSPQFIVYWNRWCAEMKPAAWFATVRTDEMTIAAIDQGRLSAVRSLALTQESKLDSGGLQKILEREALRLNLAVPAELQWCGQMPVQWVKNKESRVHCIRLDADRHDAGTPILPGVSLAYTGVPS